MSDRIQTKEITAEGSSAVPVESKDAHSACQRPSKGWLKGGIAMAICCAAPLLLVAAVTVFGISLGALASGFVSVAALLACPAGMYLMMRMMNKNAKSDE
jgi:hypothetical protein